MHSTGPRWGSEHPRSRKTEKPPAVQFSRCGPGRPCPRGAGERRVGGGPAAGPPHPGAFPEIPPGERNPREALPVPAKVGGGQPAGEGGRGAPTAPPQHPAATREGVLAQQRGRGLGATFPEPPADYPAGAAGTAQGHSPLRAPQPPARRSPPPGPPTQVTELGQEGRRAPRLAGREEIGGDTPLPSRSARAPGSALVLGAPSAGLGVDWVPCDGRFGDPESGCPVRVSRPRPHCGQEGPEPPPPPRGPVPPGSAPQEGRGGERAAAPGSLITSVRSAPLRAASCLAIPANSIPQSIGERPAFRGEQSRLGGWGGRSHHRPGSRPECAPTTAAGNSGLGAGGPATWGLGVELGGGDPTQERGTLPGSPSSAGSQRSAPSRRGKPSLLLPLPPKPTSLPVVGVPQVEVGSP